MGIKISSCKREIVKKDVSAAIAIFVAYFQALLLICLDVWQATERKRERKTK